MAIFKPKPCVNPFGKMSIFRLFKLLVFILPKKKKLEKWPFFDENHGLTPLEKCQYFYFFYFWFFIA